MAGSILIVLVAMLLAVCAIAIVYVFGVRSRSASVRDRARRFHRGLGNPLQMRSAGMPYAFASVIRHRGRKTGATYETPVWAMPTEDGFAIAIVYGPGTDWLKNVLATGTAEIVHRGETFSVDRPAIVRMDTARRYFPPTLQAIHRRMRVDRCLWVRRADAGETAIPSSASVEGRSTR